MERAVVGPNSKKVGDSVKYLVKALSIALFIYLLVRFLPMEKFTSDAAAHLLNFFGIRAQTYERQGYIYLQSLYISIECTAMRLIVVYLGLILSSKSTVTKKVILSVIFSAIVFLINVARIDLCYYLSEGGIPRVLAHDVFWYGFVIGGGILFFILSQYYLPHIIGNFHTLLDVLLNFLRSNISNLPLHQ